MNRTTFVTFASVGGVVIAGAAVIGANFGILTAADASSPLGDLSAAAEPSMFVTTTTSAESLDSVLAIYQVENAGTVQVVETLTGLSFGVVTPRDGWVWVPDSEGETLTGIFSNGTTNIQFRAVQTDGSVQAEIIDIGADGAGGPGSPVAADPPTPAVPAPVSPTTAPDSYDDDHDDDHEGRDDDHDDHDDHEGRDDDD